MTDKGNIQSCKYTNYFFGLIIVLAISLSITILVISPSVLQKTYGHAFVIDSNPSPSQSLKSPPKSVQVTLSEPVDVRYSKISVLDSTGKQVDKKDVHYVKGDHTVLGVSMPASVKDGVYTVSTKMLSEVDGHVTDNAFVFGIGKAAIPTATAASSNGAGSELSVPDALARFPSLVGQVIIVGGAFLALWIWKPLAKIGWLFTVFTGTKHRIDRSFYLLMLVGSTILILSDIAMIVVQASSIGATIGDAISTKFGSVWIIRTVLSLILIGFSVLFCYKQGILKFNTIRDRGNKNKTSEYHSSSLQLTRKVIIFYLVFGTLTLFTTSLISHGAAVSGNALTSILIDFIHNFGASLWIGGLIYLAFVIAPCIKKANLEEPIKASILSIILPRFSTIPVTVLGVIVITGPFLLYILESNLALTLASFYGKVLIIKLSLAAVMIVIGGYNQVRIYPQALKESTMITIKAIQNRHNVKVEENRAFKGNVSSDSNSIKEIPNSMNSEKDAGKIENYKSSSKTNITAISKFNRTTKIEALVGIALLLAVAVMVNSGLPDSEFQSLIQQQKQQFQNGQLLAAQTSNKPFTATSFTDDGDIITLSIDPFHPGSNNFQIRFLNSTWTLIDMNSATVRLTQTDKGIGPIEVDTKHMSSTSNEFSASASFGLPGKWEIQIEGTPKRENSPNILGTFDLLVKPSLDQTKFNVQEFRVPQDLNKNNSASQPLYPIYDKTRNMIWVGDTSIGSGRLLAYNLSSGKYYSHILNGTSIVTSIAMDSNHNNIWYVDPLNKNLGTYDPNTKSNTLYKIKSQGPPSGITIDNGVNNSITSNVWISLPADNEIARFNTQTKNFTTYHIPTPNSGPLGITADSAGLIWFAEAGSGKIASIDTNKNFIITEYPSKGSNNTNSTLKSPTALLIDPDTNDIFVSEHDGHSVSVFDPLLKTFKRYSDLDSTGLPFGMALDSYHNLWVAEHIINKISVIDTTTGEHKDINIPTKNPFTQWLVADGGGKIWFAEQRGDSLGTISSVASTLQQGTSSSQVPSSSTGVSPTRNANTIPQLGFGYADIIGPTVAAGIVFSALFYARSVIDLKRSMNRLTSMDSSRTNKNRQ
jgi:copper transport protein